MSNDIGMIMAGLGADIASLKTDINNAKRLFSSYSEHVDKNFDRVDKRIKSHERAFTNYAKTVKSGTRSVGNDFDSAFNKVDKRLDETNKKLKKSSTAFNGFIKTVRSAAIGYATVLGVMQITDFTTGIIKSGVAFDSLERSFKAITGSAALATAELRFVNKTAKDLGLNLNTLEQNYKGLLAATKDTSLEGKKTQEIFSAIAKTSAVLGLSADDTAGVLRALNQMVSKGTVQAEELRGQLGERLPGAFQLAAEAMGVTTAELGKMMENGQVLAEDLLPKLAAVLENKYGEAAESAGDRAGAAFENLKNSVLELQRAIAGSGLLEYFAELARKTTKAVNAISSMFYTIELLKKDVNAVTANIARASIKEIDELIAKQKELLLEESFNAGSIYQKDIDASVERIRALREQLEKLQEARTIKLDIENLERVSDAVDNFSRVFRTMKGDAESLHRLAAAKEFSENYIEPLSESAEKAAKALKKLREEAKATSETLGITSSLDKYATLDFSGIVDDQVIAQTIAAETSAKIWKKEHEKIYDTQKKLSAYTQDKLSEIDRKALEEKTALNKKYQEQLAKEEEEWQLQLLESKIENFYLEEEALSEHHHMLIQLENRMVEREKKIWEKAQADKKKLEEKAEREKIRAAEREAKRIERAYSDMFDTVQNHTYDIIEDWRNVGDVVKGIIKQIGKEWASAFLTQNLIMPGLNKIGSAMGMSWGGVPMSSMTGGGGLLSTASNGISLATGIPKAWNWLKSGSFGTVPGTGLTLNTHGAAAQLGIPNAGMTTNIGGQSWGQWLSGSGGSLVGGAAFGALAAVVGSKILDAFTSTNPGLSFSAPGADFANTSYSSAWLERGIGLDHTIRRDKGLKSDLFDYFIRTKETGQDAEVYDAAFSYFDTVFTSIESSLGISMNDVLEKHKHFMTSNGDVSIEKLSDDFFSETIGTLLMELFPQAGTTTLTRKTLTGYDTQTVAKVLDDLQPSERGEDSYYSSGNIDPTDKAHTTTINTPIYEMIDTQVSVLAERFNDAFFNAITPEEGNEWDAFARFGSTVKNASNFLADFNRQMDDFGESSADAFINIENITGILTTIDTQMDAIFNRPAIINTLDGLKEQWLELNAVLRESHATVEDINRSKSAYRTTIGANLTGLTGDSLLSTILSGGDIESVMKQGIAGTLAATAADSIMKQYLAPLNEKIGTTFVAGGIAAENLGLDYNKGGIYAVIAALPELTAELESGGLGDYLASITDLISELTGVTSDNANAEAELLKARESARNSINDLIEEMTGGSLAPVQSMAWFERQYYSKHSDLTGATSPEDITAAARAFTSFVPDLLEFAAVWGGDYKTLHGNVLSDLQDFGGSFDGGGVSTGPITGYPILAHGTEAHVPTQNGAIPVVVQGGGDTRIEINLDRAALRQLLRDGHREEHRSNEDVHQLVRREARI